MDCTVVLTSGGSLTGASLSLYPMAAYNFCSSAASSSFVKPATVLERQSTNQGCIHLAPRSSSAAGCGDADFPRYVSLVILATFYPQIFLDA